MSVASERAEEEAFFAGETSAEIANDTIRKVVFQLDDDGDFILLFATAEQKYAIVIVISDLSDLNWRECQALLDAVKIAERGTPMNKKTFLSLVPQLRSKYGRVDDPSVQFDHLLVAVFPGQGTISGKAGHVISKTGLSLDKDNDLMFRSVLHTGQKYQICLQLTTASALTKHDCAAFMEIMGVLETGNNLPPISFLAAGALFRAKFNFVNLCTDQLGQELTVSILASSIENPKPVHPMLKEALEQVVKMKMAQEAGSLSCPYPGIKYTKKLKESGQAQVYAGKRGEDNVAVKVFSMDEGEDDAKAAYKTELRMVLKMSKHQNVVEVFDFFETPAPALVMRLIEGEDLMDYLKKNGKCSEEEGKKLAIGIAKGLCHLHKHGVIHRDLKSLNVLRQKDGTPVIIDMGLSAELERKRKPTVTMTMQQMCSSLAATHVSDKTKGFRGSIPWMAPEMISQRVWSEKIDVYAFGLVMWEIFAGRAPFIDEDEEVEGLELMGRILGGERPPMESCSQIGPDLRAVMVDCWHADPRKRPSMKRVLDLLCGNDPREIFESFDGNKSGTLDFGEFVMFLQKYAPKEVDPGQMYSLFQAIDLDNSGEIGLEEFETFWVQVEKSGLAQAIANCHGKSMTKFKFRY